MLKTKAVTQRWTKAVKVGFHPKALELVDEDGLPKWMPDSCFSIAEDMQAFQDKFENAGWIMFMILKEQNRQMVLFRRKESE